MLIGAGILFWIKYVFFFLIFLGIKIYNVKDRIKFEGKYKFRGWREILGILITLIIIPLILADINYGFRNIYVIENYSGKYIIHNNYKSVGRIKLYAKSYSASTSDFSNRTIIVNRTDSSFLVRPITYANEGYDLTDDDERMFFPKIIHPDTIIDYESPKINFQDPKDSYSTTSAYICKDYEIVIFVYSMDLEFIVKYIFD